MAIAFSNTLMLIRTPVPVRIWGGYGHFQAPGDDPLDASGLYGPIRGQGQPTFAPLPEMNQLVGGTAEALDFGFSGVDAISQGFVDSGLANGCYMHIGKVYRDSEGVLVEPINWLRRYVISAARGEGSANSASVFLTAESFCAYRARSMLRRWSDADHKSRHPGDNFARRSLLNSYNRTLKYPG